MRVDIITIFPDYFGPGRPGRPGQAGQAGQADGASGGAGPLGVSLIGKAGARGDIDFRVHDLRRWATDVHHTVDDTPFGGGPGMVMKPDVWGAALDAVLADAAAGQPAAAPRLVVPTPSGMPFTQAIAADYAAQRHLVFACGRYEGIDGRVVRDARTRMAVDEISIGDYVLAGGEAAVVVIVEAVCRLLPGVLGNEQSVADDSFGGGRGAMQGLLEGPVYTRPRSWRGQEVPHVLLSGDHAAIARWQRDEALRRTAATRPDLIRRLAAAPGGLDARDRTVLIEAGFPVDGENMAH
ncbi:tRNA (guanosine(37)-N1)-methyltransferase TrmD [Trebonia sp.]|uniref:tRNA (guanosine(37)-N1)-methyltransferase TrmD n=1 Tax=Trebonia sp. TaxID=2767075 RepID=UPI002630248B|nr:tRNA (guanosine(37)-N1)-methyltransferase TrmD [Trebonia sp.]